MDFRFLVDVNATLNATAFILTVSGLVAIKRGKEATHKRLMLAAACVSAFFLASYLTYHVTCEPVRFRGEGGIRVVYFAILISHVILAAALAPLLVTTVILGLRDRRDKHRRFARITAPIWIYVSVTGVAVYFMLYHW